VSDTKDFDASQCLRPPRLDVRQAFSLAIALLRALPKAPEAGVRRSAKALRKAAVALQVLWAARERALKAVKSVDKVAGDNRIDTAWGALKMRISGYAMLPPAAYPRAARAEAQDKTLFPSGMSFLKAPMEAEWAVSEQLLEQIDDDKLATEIDAVAGPDFLVEIRAAHTVYGEVLGITKAHTVPEDVAALLEPLRAVVRAIGDYAIQIVASVDREDAASIKVAKNALLPMDRYREGAARRAAKGGKPVDDLPPDATPDTPVPEVADIKVK
jgi:hypothetical protein